MSERRPHVLLVCVDHWPGRLIGALGHPTILTPTLNRLAANGILFTRAYSTTPSCIPARRELYTGTFSRTHGDRVFAERLPMPPVPTIAHSFRDAGYQTYAVGKLHVYPQRARIGFDEVILNEEGRHHLGLRADDYELFLTAEGYAGREMTHGMGNNDYCARPWHLPEYCHPINWTVREMCRAIARRDPTRPSFWYLSFHAPHPPLVPLRDYLDMYRDVEIDMPRVGEWAATPETLPYALRARRLGQHSYSEAEVRLARQAFYALCTHVDHQLRLVIGTLREEGLLDDTLLLFTGDHGEMLGNHGLWSKEVFYEESANVPLILVPAANDPRVAVNRRDDRLATLGDVMPTLLELCGIPAPPSVEGMSLVGDARREDLYGEHWEGPLATRMVHDGRHKLIYYPVGHRTQLFDLECDPDEQRDVAGDTTYASVRDRLTRRLTEHLYGSDREWLDGEKLVGLPRGSTDRHQEYTPEPDRGLGGQRGWRFY